MLALKCQANFKRCHFPKKLYTVDIVQFHTIDRPPSIWVIWAIWGIAQLEAQLPTVMTIDHRAKIDGFYERISLGVL